LPNVIANAGSLGTWSIIEITTRDVLSTRVWARPQPPWTYTDDSAIDLRCASNDEFFTMALNGSTIRKSAQLGKTWQCVSNIIVTHFPPVLQNAKVIEYS